jgi:hypothetical protein
MSRAQSPNKRTVRPTLFGQYLLIAYLLGSRLLGVAQCAEGLARDGGHPQNQRPLGPQWCRANSVRSDRAVPFATAADRASDCLRTAAAVMPRRRIMSKVASGRFGSNLLTTTHRNKPAKQKVSMSNEVRCRTSICVITVLMIMSKLR